MSAQENNALVVPINVQALCVNESGSTSFGPFIDFSKLPRKAGEVDSKTALGATTINDPVTKGNNLSEGIHLHWALPKAFTVLPQSDTAAELRAVPDTWLIVRLTGGSSGLGNHSWVLESNRINAFQPESSAAIPIPNDLVSINSGTDPIIHYMGQRTLMENWSPNSEAAYVSPLTAFGHGVAHFSGYYQNCQGVFGTYDDLGGHTKDFDCSYVVIGWYRDAQNDPATTFSDVNDLLSTYNWVLDPSLKEVTEKVDRTLYMGVVSGVNFKETAPTKLKDVNLKVAVGASTRSALSAMVAKETAGDDAVLQATIEKTLMALQTGKEHWLDQLDGITEMDELIHWAGFASSAPGTFQVLKAVGSEEAGSNTAPKGALPDSVVCAYQDLYELQTSALAKKREGDSLMKQLFVDWQNYIQQASSGSASNEELSKMRAAMISNSLYTSNGSDQPNAEYDLAQAAYKAYSNLLQQAEQQAVVLNQALVSAKLDKAYELSETSEPPYYAPHDPAVAFCGEVFNPVNRTGGANPLPIRLSSQVATGLSIEGSLLGKDGRVSVDTSKLTQPTLKDVLPAKGLLQDLITEAILSDPNQVGNILSALGEVTADSKALEQALKTCFEGKANKDLSYTGNGECVTLPDPLGMVSYSNDLWSPIYLAWEVNYTPYASSDSYAANEIGKDFQLNTDETELVLKGNYTQPTAKPSVARGIGFISSSHSEQVSKALRRHAETELGAEERSLFIESANDYDDNKVYTAILGNFSNQLLQLSHEPQLPAVDLVNLGSTSEAHLFTSFAHNNLEGQVTLDGHPVTHSGVAQLSDSTDFPSFNPLRSGLASISKLYVVDTFGRYSTLVDSESTIPLYTDTDFTVPDKSTAQKPDFWLPPHSKGAFAHAMDFSCYGKA